LSPNSLRIMEVPAERYYFKDMLSIDMNSTVFCWGDHEKCGFVMQTEDKDYSFVTRTAEERDMWVGHIQRVIQIIFNTKLTKQVKNPIQYFMISQCEGFIIEPSSCTVSKPSHLFLDDSRNDVWYYRNFFVGKDHVNYLGGDDLCPVAISIENRKDDRKLLRKSLRSNSSAEEQTFKCLVRTPDGNEYVTVTSPTVAPQDIMNRLCRLLPQLPNLQINQTLYKVKNISLIKTLVEYEAKCMFRAHKVGLVYQRKGQTTETEIYGNAAGSPEFEEFLTYMGDYVPLKGFSGYTGGLDIETNQTGTHSIFTNFWGIHVMFHVSTLLPEDPNNKHISKKRHIGNDVVVFIFKDSDDTTPFSPTMFRSHYNHIFFVIQPHKTGNTKDGKPIKSYRLAIVAKEGVPTFGPPLPYPPIFEKDAYFRQFLLSKMVNAERASMRSAAFSRRLTQTRQAMLRDLWEEYSVKPKLISKSV